MIVRPRIQWSDEFVVLDVQSPLMALLALLTEDGPYYILLRRNSDLLYVFLASELSRMPGIRKYRFMEPAPDATVLDQLEIHEPDSSHLSGPDGLPRPHPYDVPAGRNVQPSRQRFVAIGADGNAIAVGEDAGNLMLGGDRPPRNVDLALIGQAEKKSAGSRTEPSEARWLNAGISGHAPDAPLEIGMWYVLEFGVDVKKSGDASARVPAAEMLFGPGEDVIELTVQVDSEDFEVAQEALPLKLPRTGPSDGKACFGISPKKEGRGTLTATIHKEGNFLLEMVISYSVGAGPAEPVTTVAHGRPIAAAASLRPRDLSITIQPAPGGYECRMLKPVHKRVTLPITGIELGDAIGDARGAMMSVVTQLDDQSERVFQSGLDIDKSSEERALRTLAEAGGALFQRIFFGPMAGPEVQAVGNLIRKCAADPAVKLKILIASESFPVPWSLLYIGETAAGAPLRWDLFLGMRHIIDQIPLQTNMLVEDTVIPSDSPSLAVSVNLNTNIDEREDGVIAQQTRFWSDCATAFGPRMQLAKGQTRADVLAALSSDANDQLMYLYCHAVTKGPGDEGGIHDSYLVLTGNQQLSLGDLNREAPMTERLRGNPLVFINACESAELTPAFYDGFVPYFMAKGARGVVGTECETPAVFGAEWALRFFPRFLAGEPLGQLFLDLRQEFCTKHRNPLGLMYAVYCDAETQVQPGLTI